MLEENTFARADTVPSWFANAIQKFLSVSAGNFQVLATDATHVKIPAGVDDQAAAIAIHGLWRWAEADVGPVAHPGGAAGLYPLFVTAKNNSIVSTPLPYTDNTDRSFGLQIKAPGTTPTIVAGTVDQYRRVADITWDGAKIMGIDQVVPKPLASTADAQPGDLITSFASTRAGAVLCDGAAYTLSSNPQMNALAAACPTLVAAGVLTVPDFKGRVVVGAGAGGGLTARTVGQSGGEENHLLTSGESGLPAHPHSVSDPGHAHTYLDGVILLSGTAPIGPAQETVATAWGDESRTTAGNGTGVTVNNNAAANAAGSHNNMQPYRVANIFIKL